MISSAYMKNFVKDGLAFISRVFLLKKLRVIWILQGTDSYNVAYRCDAYNNVGYDKASIGNADGFGGHGTGAEFLECRAWDNSDDNYDCISSYGRNIFDTCWAFRLNLATSNIQDGNGFKIGGLIKIQIKNQN